MTFDEIKYDARRLVTGKGDSTVYSTTDITYSSNRALERVTGLIRDAQGRWQWQDSNNTTELPSATTALEAAVADYPLDPTHYRIQRVEVKDTAGQWTKLTSIDQTDVYDQALTSFLSTSGVPQYYDKVGNSIILYPKPSYAQDASLRLYYEAGPEYFTTSDSNQSPGFNPLFHRLISLWCAHDYGLIHTLTNKGEIDGDIALMETALTDHYSLRDRDEHITLKARVRNMR